MDDEIGQIGLDSLLWVWGIDDVYKKISFLDSHHCRLDRPRDALPVLY